MRDSRPKRVNVVRIFPEAKPPFFPPKLEPLWRLHLMLLQLVLRRRRLLLQLKL
jgi:hypothetical protein